MSISSLRRQASSTLHDDQLDIYRALTMIYILCIIHVAYWLGAVSEPVKSIILFEMPVIFFISGAALSISRKRRRLSEVVSNRTKRVILPYYAYALVCTIATIPYFSFIESGETKALWKIAAYAIVPRDDSVGLPYAWHLWFIIPYFIISCSFYFQQNWADALNTYQYLGILLALCIATQLTTDNRLVRSVVFYNFFFISGYLLYRKLSIKIISLLLAIATSAFIILYFFFWEGSMQFHKFPCDMLFLSFGLVALSILGLIFSYVRLPQNRVLRWWNKYGYTIYLWQNISFIMVRFLMLYIPGAIRESIWGFLLQSAMIFLLSTAISFIAVPYEKFFMILLTKIPSLKPKSANDSV